MERLSKGSTAPTDPAPGPRQVAGREGGGGGMAVDGVRSWVMARTVTGQPEVARPAVGTVTVSATARPRGRTATAEVGAAMVASATGGLAPLTAVLTA